MADFKKTFELFVCFVSVVSVVCEFNKDVGDICSNDNGESGSCKFAEDCPTFKESLSKGESPVICSFEGLRVIVCCIGNSGSEKPINVTVKEPDVETRFGTIAKEKCKEYSQYVWDIRSSPTLLVTSDVVKKFDCALQNNELIVGGTLSAKKEFPHMALLGYETEESIKWACGGSIISEDFILTAAHCINNREFGEVKKVRIGITNLTDLSYMQEFDVKERYKHPDYKSNSHYHDIALVRLSGNAKLGPWARPACLYTEKNIRGTKCLACGWGNTEYGGKSSNDLLKVVLEFFDKPQCEKTYKSQIGTQKLLNGIEDHLMVCAGSSSYLRDTCQGDSGGPLQIYHKGEDAKCMYDIVGVTSFGKACGIAVSIPGVYTRVSNYIQWIESIVWPGK